ncbi:MAG TPA: undecaprenyl-diphosphate phosphatase, partial [Tepidisphaeraceae bacterium]
AATIMGGLVAGLSRQAATEFSFFLAIPAMFAACGYDLLKHRKDLMGHADRLLLLVIGTLVSFLVAWVVIAAFMAYIRRHNFIPFAVYRIILAAVVILAFHGT